MRHDRGMRPGRALEDGMFVRLGQSELVMIERRDLVCLVVRIAMSGGSVDGGGDAIQERNSRMMRPRRRGSRESLVWRRSVLREMQSVIHESLTLGIDCVRGTTASVVMVMPRMMTQVTLERVRRGGGSSPIRGNGDVSRCHDIRGIDKVMMGVVMVMMMQLRSSGGGRG